MTISFLDSPQKVGVSDEMLVRLDQARAGSSFSPDLLPYLDLIESSAIDMPDAVVQVDGRAVMYVIRPQVLGGEQVDSKRLSGLIRALACRGDARYLGLLYPGCLSVYPIGITDQSPLHLGDISLSAGNTEFHEFLTGQHSLANTDSNAADSNWLDNFLFDLLTKTAEQLKSVHLKFSDSEVLSLIGRCLFLRFISDRNIISDSTAAIIAPHKNSLDELLATPSSTACTFSWLDRTFNGNILPVISSEGEVRDYCSYFIAMGDVADTVCTILNNIMRRAPGGQLQLFWDGILFQHVPADMLSQVYEHFAHAYQSDHAKSTSIHYTPRHIAQQLVDAAFAGMKTAQKDRAKVLDPASGAGVFLVLALKRLVQEHWKKTGKRPDRQAIRNILNAQVYGFDINRESLKFAALSLYLTALELDPEPTPLDDLKFDRLSGKTLIYVGEDSDYLTADKGHVDRRLGSLSESLVLPEDLKGGVDLVIGNPPWTELGSKYKARLDEQVRRIAAKHGVSPLTVSQLKVDNGVPDIPFIWRALEWSKPGGMIAYALHAQHLLFRQGNSAIMRSALFQCIEITGILNASALRNEARIWPNITAPFCFLVARSERPNADSSFYFLSPAREKRLNDQALFRLDPQAATSVAQVYAINVPWLFKVLARGSSLDLEVTAKIAAIDLDSPRNGLDSDALSLADDGGEDGVCKRESLSDLWRRYNLKNRDGIQTASAKSARDARHLYGLPYLTKHLSADYRIDTQLLPRFDIPTLYRPYERESFNAPLVLFRESPKKRRDQRGAIVSFEDVVFRETFFGYSCAGHSHPDILAKYLQLLSLSDVFIYWSLMTSSKFGIERDAILKEDVDAFPVVPFEKLSNNQIEDILRISTGLYEGQLDWGEVDRFVGKLYGLNRADLGVISDTLEVGLPYSQNKDYAERAPKEEIGVFIDELMRIVMPFAHRNGRSIEVTPLESENKCWRFIWIKFSEHDACQRSDINTRLATDIADHFWASQVRLYLSAGSLIVGQVAQNRYWTRTRGRLLALDLLSQDIVTR